MTGGTAGGNTDDYLGFAARWRDVHEVIDA
jgi:hypothetical protein